MAAVPSCSSDRFTAPQPARPVADVGLQDGSTAPPNLVIVEMMGDPKAVTDANGEWVKLYNPGPADVDLQNFQIRSSYGTTLYPAGRAESHTIASSIVVPVGSCVVLGNNTDVTTNGGVNEAYSYGTSITLGNNNTDWVTISSSTGALLDSVAYSASTIDGTARTITTGYSIQTGISRAVIDPSQDNTAMSDASNWQSAAVGTTYGAGDHGTPNSCDYTWRAPAGGQAGPISKVSIVAPNPATVTMGKPLQLTAKAQDDGGNTVTADPARFTWKSSNEAVATVSSTGVVTGVAVSTTPVVITATSIDVPTLSATVSLDVVVPPANVTVSSRTVPLPVGFQTELFAGGTDLSGNPVSGQAIVWSSSDNSILTVDQDGVITAAGVGSAKIRVTAPDGSYGETTVATESQLFSSTARAGHNLELGTPVDGNPSDDLIITRKQYTISYNAHRGGPNWVSWDLSSTHLGASDRCNCFSADTALARLGAAGSMFTTADYVAGGQWDRGHMEPSADQTSTDTENGATFFLSNVLPQRHDLNAGPWERLEIALRDSAQAGREIYTIAGGIFTNGVGLGTLNDGGRIAIPDSTWKIAVIMPANGGLGQITSPQSVTVIAVNMPNVTGISGNGWEMYQTTVDKIQHSTGYNFLSSIPEQIQCRIEVRNCSPAGAFSVSAGSALENVALSFDASASSDVDGDALSYAWNFGDGSTASGVKTSHAYSHAGTYTVTLTVTDGKGGTAQLTASVIIRTPSQGIQTLVSAVNTQGQGLNHGQLNSLTVKLNNAIAALQRGSDGAASNMLGAFINEVSADIQSGTVSSATGNAWIQQAQTVIQSIGG
jgi:DNA/RNA endonuclease G (NUC1)